MVLLPFAKMNAPIISLNLISWTIMLIASIIVIYKAPFKTFTKVLVLLSPPFLYWFAAISRSYSLIALLVLLVAYMYDKKEKYPVLYAILLAFLSNTHIIMLAFVGLLICDFYGCELIKMFKTKQINKQIVISIIIILLGMLLVALPLMQSLTSNKEINDTDIFLNIKNNTALFITSVNSSLCGVNESNFIIALILFAALNVIMFNMYDSKFKIIYLINIMYYLFVYIFIYKFNNQTMYTLYLIILALSWISYRHNDSKVCMKDIIISAITIATFMGTITIYANDIEYNFSGAKQMGEYIYKNISPEAKIISLCDFTATPVGIYCPDNDICSIITGEKITFVTWNEKRKEELTTEKLLNAIQENFNKDIYILCSSNIDIRSIIEKVPEKYKIEKMYQTDISITQDEEYSIYYVEK